MTAAEQPTFRVRPTEGPLHKKLAEVLPAYVHRDGVLNVHRFKGLMAMSSEGVYKWLRHNRLSAKAVLLIVDLAASEPNVTLLRNAGREPPTREEFIQFCFPA